MEESPAASLSDVLNWRSLRWNDGCTYEGLEARGACESHGVVTWPGRRERYEGQLVGSRPHGHGAYRWRDGTLYRGEWYAGHMHGCGVLIWRDAQGEVQAQAGKFYYVGAVSGCTAEDAHEAALEADTAAARARSFEAQRRAGAPAATSAGTAAPMRSGAFPASAAISTSLPPSRPGLPSSSSGWQQRSLSGSAASSWGGGAAGGGGSASAGRWAAARDVHPLSVVKAAAGPAAQGGAGGALLRDVLAMEFG